MTRDLERKFEKVLREWESSKDLERIPFKPVWRMMHDLAENQYPPALQFFVDSFDHSDWSWREEFVRLAGFHYPLDPKGEIVSRIRRLLLNDPSAEVRMTAASVLGARSRWPDEALLSAIEDDKDSDVREAAFRSLLRLRGLSPLEANSVLREALEQGSELDGKELQRILETTDTS